MEALDSSLSSSNSPAKVLTYLPKSADGYLEAVKVRGLGPSDDSALGLHENQYYSPIVLEHIAYRNMCIHYM